MFTVTKKKVKWPCWPLVIFAMIFMCLECVFLFIMHFAAWIHQAVYFSIIGIPKIPFKEFLVLDRDELKKLNWFQHVGCIYCGYGNAVVAYAKATVNMTELYSCAIKHDIAKRGQEHQKKFFEYAKFK